MKRKPIAIAIVVAGFLFLVAPSLATADLLISRFLFITDPQAIVSGAVSGELKIQAQDADGNPVSAGKTLCLGLLSTSKTGEFSSNADNWNPVNALTINSNWTARAFYYKDSGAGNYRIDASVAIKPDGMTCAVWPVADWTMQWSAHQNITIGASAVSSGASLASPSSAAASTSGGASSSYHAPVLPLPPAPTITAFAGEDRTALVGVEENFIGEAMGLVREPIANARFWWNFGDGGTAEGRSVGHSYREPGAYTVALHVSSGEYAASDYAVATVIPNKITIAGVTAGEGGSIRIRNPAPVGADIGGWSMEDQTNKQFFFPVRTIIAPNAEVAFANRVTGLSPDSKVILRYPGGSLATGWDAGAIYHTQEKTGAGGSAAISPLAVSVPQAIAIATSSWGREPPVSSVKKESVAAASVAVGALAPSPRGAVVPDAMSKKTTHFPSVLFSVAFVLSAFAAAGFFLVRHIF